MSFWNKKKLDGSVNLDGQGSLSPDLKSAIADGLLDAMKPGPTVAEAKKALAALREMKKDAGQITFYVYDRGQCYTIGAEAVLAMVNMNGCAAHYIIDSESMTWTFFQMPHLNTEKRAAFRMGYKSVEAMHEHLFDLFGQHLVKIGWHKRHNQPVAFAASPEEGQ